jgi:hypothetical protein
MIISFFGSPLPKYVNNLGCLVAFALLRLFTKIEMWFITYLNREDIILDEEEAKEPSKYAYSNSRQISLQLQSSLRYF